MINFRHNIATADLISADDDFDTDAFDAEAAAIAAKKLAKKLRRQARDEMRAMFDFDGIRANAADTVTADDAIDIFDATEDPDAVWDAFVAAM